MYIEIKDLAKLHKNPNREILQEDVHYSYNQKLYRVLVGFRYFHFPKKICAAVKHFVRRTELLPIIC